MAAIHNAFMRFYLLLVIFFFLGLGAIGYASNGVLTSSNARVSAGQANQDALMEEQVDRFLEATIIQTLIRTMGQDIERTVRQARIGLMPDFAFIAAQQGASQCFQQPQLLELIREIYREARESSTDALRNGESSSRVQEDIARKLETDLRLLVQEPVYQQIVEKVIEHVYEYQQRLVMQNMMQQYLQQLSQHQQSLQEELVEQYQKGIWVR